MPWRAHLSASWGNLVHEVSLDKLDIDWLTGAGHCEIAQRYLFGLLLFLLARDSVCGRSVNCRLRSLCIGGAIAVYYCSRSYYLDIGSPPPLPVVGLMLYGVCLYVAWCVYLLGTYIGSVIWHWELDVYFSLLGVHRSRGGIGASDGPMAQRVRIWSQL